MPNEQSIDQIVSPKAIKQVDVDLVNALERSEQALQDNIVAAKQLNDILGRSTSLTNYNQNLRNSSVEQERVNQAIIRTQIAQQRLEAQTQRLADQQARQTQRTNDQTRAYAQLDAEHKKLVKDAQDLGIALGENSREFREAAARANEVGQRLSAVDQRLGNYRRNVGNYASGFNGLSNSINQITREFPAFSNSVQTGFLAISNNLPIFFDQIAMTRREIAAMRAEGQQVPGLFSQLTKSIFSFGTVLSLGVTLLTVYGKDIVNFVAAIFKGKEALDQFAISQKAVSDANLKGAQNAQLELVQLRSLYSAAQNINLSSEQRYSAAKKLQDQYPQTFKNYTIEQIELGKVDAGYKTLTESIIANAKAQASAQKIAENESRKLDNQQKIVDLQKQQIKNEAELKRARSVEIRSTQSVGAGVSVGGNQSEFAATAAQGAVIRTQKDINDLKTDSNILTERNLALTKNIVDQQKKILPDFIDPEKSKKPKKDKSTNEEDLRGIIEQSKDIVDNDKLEYQTRFEALESFLSASQQLAGKDQIKRTQALSDYEKMRADLTKKANDEALKNITEAEKLEIQAIKDANNEALQLIEERRSDAIEFEAVRYSQGIINKKQYEENIAKIDKQAGIDAVQAQIETSEAIIAIQRSDLAVGIGTVKELSDSEKQLSDLKIRLSKLTTDELIKDADRRAAKEKEINDKIQELSFATFEFGVKAIDGIFTRRQNKLQEEIDLNTLKKQQDIENVNDSVASEADKADQIAIINAKAAAQQEVLEQRQRQEKVKQAKFDKVAAVAKIIAETAIKVAEFGFFTPFAILAASLGAVAVATVLATPIPAFEKGGVVKKDGVIQTGEKGVEGRINPDGSFELTEGKTNLSMAKAGTRIISNPDLKKMIAKPHLNHFVGGQQIDISKLIESNDKVGSKIESAVKKISVPTTIITKGGWFANSNRMGSLQSHINKNFGRRN